MKQEKRLQTIDGESLMNLPLQPLRFAVDSLLSQGLHVLAGSPKVGKSWLALWLSVAVAKGEPVWGIETQQGTTLYLCLEDSTLRMQYVGRDDKTEAKKAGDHGAAKEAGCNEQAAERIDCAVQAAL